MWRQPTLSRLSGHNRSTYPHHNAQCNNKGRRDKHLLILKQGGQGRQRRFQPSPTPNLREEEEEEKSCLGVEEKGTFFSLDPAGQQHKRRKGERRKVDDRYNLGLASLLMFSGAKGKGTALNNKKKERKKI